MAARLGRKKMVGRVARKLNLQVIMKMTNKKGKDRQDELKTVEAMHKGL